MFFVTGDIHGNPSRFSTESFPEQKEMNKEEDYVCILGDFGLVWDYKGENKEEKYWLDWLEDKPFTTLFIDGNHEHHIRLNEYPVKAWNGGLVHEIRPHVLHLMRGEIFNIDSKKIFAFGSASSHDIQDGIIDGSKNNWKEVAKEWEKKGKYMYRIEGISWWKEELPNEKEMQNGLYNLEKNDYKVDYIFTHSPPASVITMLGHVLYEQDVLTKYLENIRIKTEYNRHLMGHMHIDKAINDKDILLYEQIVRLF